MKNFKLKYKTAALYLLGLISIVYNANSQTIQFEESARQYGLDYTFIDPQDYGTGISLYDFNQDGFDDLFFGGFEDELLHFYVSQDSTFVPVTFEGIDSIGYRSKCLMWIDFDNDDDLDLSVTTIGGPIKLFENKGDFTFKDITQSVGIQNLTMNSYASCWGDYNKDGLLDLYAVNRESSSNGSRNRLFENNGDGTFTNVSNWAGVYDHQGLAYAAVFLDYDKDGWPDIFIANDKAISENRLYRNLGDGTFLDVSDPLTTGIKMDGMGIGVGDFDHNGYEDLYISNTSQSSPDFGGNVFLKNNGDGTFTDIAAEQDMRVFSTSWGVNMNDFNNDSHLDIYVGNEGPTDEYKRNRLFVNLGDGNFAEDTLNEMYTTFNHSFSTAVGDVNNDGFSDIAVLNTAETSMSLWINKEHEKSWIKVKLEGTISNKDGIGSWIEAFFNGQQTVTYTRCGSGFGAQSSANYILGLGESQRVDSLIIRWPSSDLVNTYYDLEVNESYHFTEHDNSVIIDTTSTDTTTISDTTTIDTTDINTFLNNTFKESFEFSIFPNPSNGKFYLSLDVSLRELRIEIINQKGNIVDEFRFDSSRMVNHYEFDLNHLPPGVYYIKIKNNQQTSIRKWIKL